MDMAAEKNQALTDAIIQKADELERLQAHQKKLESESAEKLRYLEDLKKSSTSAKKNQHELSDRNTVIREKLQNLDKNTRVEADRISDEMKSFFKKLGLRVTQRLLSDDNQVELKIQFKECLEFDATFIYDSITEDYDCKFTLFLPIRLSLIFFLLVISLNPEHPNFIQLRDCLRESKDIQGFLVNYRKKVLKMILERNEIENMQ